MDCPKDLRYAPTHEWVRLSGGTALIGITRFAVEQLRDLVYLDLPQVGRALKCGEPFGEIESVKAVSDLVSPVSGTVTKVNAALSSDLERLHTDPYQAGWMIEVQLSDAGEIQGLLDGPAYEKHTAS